MVQTVGKSGTPRKGGTFEGVIASAALWEGRNMVGTDGCFWPVLYRVRTFREVWAKLVRKPIVRSAHLF